MHAQAGPSGEASVVLDIGGDVGALVVHVPPGRDGEEIDLFPLGSDRPCTHAAVRRRDVPGGPRYALVYPDLAAGEYRLAGVPAPVEVRGGEVIELELT